MAFDDIRMVTQHENRRVRFSELLIQARERLARTDGLLDPGTGLRAVEACPDGDARSHYEDHRQERSYNIHDHLAASRYAHVSVDPAQYRGNVRRKGAYPRQHVLGNPAQTPPRAPRRRLVSTSYRHRSG